jgi:hypothetical protein
MMEVFSRMLVLRRVAAANVAAFQAHAQVDPRVTDFYTVFTNVLVSARNHDLIEMCTVRCHFSSVAEKPEGTQPLQLRQRAVHEVY